jgi:DNA polymerase
VFPVGRLEFDRVGNWLRIKLPSGRHLCYPSPKIDPETGKISYMGQDQYTRRWQRIYTYGGKIAENATQAIATGAFGLLGAALPRLEAAGYEIVFHVHDEPVAEVPDSSDYSAKEMSAILATPPDWPGIGELPLAAGGYETHRYRKD